jgi:hypothetical protein
MPPRNTAASKSRTSDEAPRFVLLPVKVPPAMRRELRLLARAETGGNVSALIRRFLSDGIDRELAKPGV